MEKKIKENIEVAREEVDIIDRSQINIQKFMDDMRMLGLQVNNKDLDKPVFNYGDASVTNYLLWTMLGELQILNNTIYMNNMEFEEEFDEEEENA